MIHLHDEFFGGILLLLRRYEFRFSMTKADLRHHPVLNFLPVFRASASIGSAPVAHFRQGGGRCRWGRLRGTREDGAL